MPSDSNQDSKQYTQSSQLGFPGLDAYFICLSDRETRPHGRGVLSFLHLMEKLKMNKRAGWLKMGVGANTESIADHMLRMQYICMTVEDPALDMNRCFRMAAVHDMAEAIVGDITPSDGISLDAKYKLELDAMETIKGMLEGNAFGQEALDLWLEYAADSSAEAQFVKDADKLELIIQACEYEREGINFEGWIQACKDKIRHVQLRAILAEVLHERSLQQ